MTENNQFYLQSLMLNTEVPFSLKDQALTKLAIQICQCSDFKKHIINTPKQARMYSMKYGVTILFLPFYVWADFITEQCSAICEKLLPHKLKSSLTLRIREIAMRMINWYKEQKLRLQMTPELVDRFFMSTDWTAEGTIDERKIAERLVQEERLPIALRYRIACSFFLESSIRLLWPQLPQKVRERYCYDENSDDYRGISNLSTQRLRANLKIVVFWSRYLQGQSFEHKYQFWRQGFELAVEEGRRTAVTCCWKALTEIQKHEAIITAAMSALWEYCGARCITTIVYPIDKNIKHNDRNAVGLECWEHSTCSDNTWCTVPEYYRDIFNFLFSQMFEEQKFEIFQNAFDINSTMLQSVFSMPFTRCSRSERPSSEMLIQGVSKLWVILPVKYFKRVLFTLLNGNANTCEYQDFDHEHLLLELLERTPDHYKTYLFRDMRERVQYEDHADLLLLLALFNLNSFEQINIEMIQIILQQATVEENRALMHDNCGSEICEYFMKNKKLETVDLILEYCLPEEEIPTFKKELLSSQKGFHLCLEILAHESVEFVHLLLQWGNFSESEISEIKPKMIREGSFSLFQDLLEKGKLDCLDKIEEYCLPSDDARKEFRQEFFLRYANTMCNAVLQRHEYRYLKHFLSSDFVWEKDEVLLPGCTQVLMNIFANVWVPNAHCFLKIVEDHIKDKKFVVKWCGSSPRKLAMDLIKKDVMLLIRETIFQLLRSDNTKNVPAYLKWYLSDIENAITFKKQFEKYVTENLDVELNSKCGRRTKQRKTYETKQRILGTWDQLMKDQIRDLQKPREPATKRRATDRSAYEKREKKWRRLNFFDPIRIREWPHH